AETCSKETSPHSQPQKLQWGRCANAAETKPTIGDEYPEIVRFNGAAARTQRRPARLAKVSRGPVPGFNGAAARTQRRLRGDISLAGDLLELQWGRCANAAETWRRLARPRRPPRLQWGRCANAAETHRPQYTSARGCSLQWGRCANAA